VTTQEEPGVDRAIKAKPPDGGDGKRWELGKMSKSYCNLIYHLVFSTKDRHPWLRNDIRTRTYEYLGGAIRDEGGIALVVGGTTDHVHILAKLRQDKAVSGVLRDIKSNSSGWIHRTFAKLPQFGWQAGYGGFSVSASQVEKVRQYVVKQEEHHKTQSFKEEYIALLDAHGIEYDERYLWD
jgi:putative transposase